MAREWDVLGAKMEAMEALWGHALFFCGRASWPWVLWCLSLWLSIRSESEMMFSNALLLSGRDVDTKPFWSASVCTWTSFSVSILSPLPKLGSSQPRSHIGWPVELSQQSILPYLIYLLRPIKLESWTVGSGHGGILSKAPDMTLVSIQGREPLG